MNQIGNIMKINKLHTLAAVAVVLLSSCEKVWEEDLKERALDTIRGEYEIVSVVWEEDEPIDINGDGTASFDYFAEWNEVYPIYSTLRSLHNDGGTLDIPVTTSKRVAGSAYPERTTFECRIDIRTVIDGNEARLEFSCPHEVHEFEHIGYGEVAVRAEVCLTVQKEIGVVEEISGTIYIKYKRKRYWGN
jgi:hypothetical protein